jgi:hypothetical protein
MNQYRLTWARSILGSFQNEEPIAAPFIFHGQKCRAQLDINGSSPKIQWSQVAEDTTQMAEVVARIYPGGKQGGGQQHQPYRLLL